MRTVTAKFENGHSIKRGSLNKVYTHAWLVVYDRDEDGARRARAAGWPQAKPFSSSAHSGFATSRDLAARALQTEVNRWAGRHHATIRFQGIVPVQIIDPSSKGVKT